MERRVTLRDSHMITLLVTSAKREEMREGSQVIIVVAVIPIQSDHFVKLSKVEQEASHKSRHPTNTLDIKVMANLSYNTPRIIGPERVCL